MFTSRLFRLPYRLLQRVFVLEGVAVLVAQASDTAGASQSSRNAESLSKERLQHYLDLGEAPFCETLVERLDDDRISCFGVEANGSLLSFAWFCRGEAEAEMNYGRHPSTATPLLLSPNVAFVFHAYTAPHVRGQGLLSAVLRKAAESLLEDHKNASLVSTTELTNSAALSAFRGCGFHRVGTYWRFGIGSRVAGWYPRAADPIQQYG